MEEKMLNFNDTKKMLARYSIYYQGAILKNEKELEKAVFPAVLKASSEKIVHKTEAGGVKVGIKNKEDLLKAYNELKRLKCDVLIQEQKKGTEIIIGMKKDSQFGPVILFGLGGVFVEVMKDVSLRIAPVDKKMALEMIKETKGFRLLDGFRGGEKANIDAIADIIEKVSKLSLKENVREIDLNPVIVNKKDAFVVDARVLQ